MDVVINGCRLSVEVEGQGEPTIFTLHGGPGLSSKAEPKIWVGPLGKEHRCVFFDQRGNGDSDDPEPKTLTHRQYVDDAEALRRHLDLAKIALFGGSYGGFIAMYYALRFPQRVTHMILRGTAPSWHHAEDAIENGVKAQRPGLTRKVLERGFDGLFTSNEDYAGFFELIQPLYSTQQADPKALKEKLKSRKWHYQTHNAFFSRAHGDFFRYDIRPELPKIRVKTLVIAGRHDWITPWKWSQEIADLIPGARLEIFEDAGHAVHADSPTRFHALLREFLAS